MAGISVFKVLGDRQRRDILVLLKDGRLSAGEIAQKLGISPAALSYHLKLLKQADLVLEYKSGNFIFYEINTSVLQEVILWVQQFGGVHEKDHVPDRGAERSDNAHLDPSAAGYGADAL